MGHYFGDQSKNGIKKICLSKHWAEKWKKQFTYKKYKKKSCSSQK